MSGPEAGEARSLAGDAGLEIKRERWDGANSAGGAGLAQCPRPNTLDPKVRATLIARAAMVGVVLRVTDDDHGAPLFIASKWAMTRQLHSVAEVESFLRGIGGPRA